MTLELPDVIASFLAAEKTGDLDTLVDCLVRDAVVKDGGRTFSGVGAIRKWMTDARQKYRRTVEPIAVVTEGGTTTVTARISGDFRGSPVIAEHIFAIKGGRIVSLEIR